MPDSTVSKMATRAECENLVTHLADPALLDAPFSAEKLQAWHDELMMFSAMAVLLPWDARASLLEDYQADKARLGAIASSVDLPESVVELVLSEHWPRLHETISGRR